MHTPESMTDASLVGIVIPVHARTRPLARAVASAVHAAHPLAPGQFSITVVAHHLTVDQVRGMLSPEQIGQVRVVEAPRRGVTAALPRTVGLEHARATYISFLDSDDTYQPGAVARWVSLAERHNSDLVIPWLKHTDGHADLTPMLRPGRTRNLSAVADRLVYRSSVFGLQRVDTVRRLGAAFDHVTATGEDQAYMLRLYAGARRIDYAPGEPTYVMHSDAADRVSRVPLPVRSQLEPAVRIAATQWFPALPEALRRAFVVKVIRVNLFASAQEHLRAGTWDRNQARETHESLNLLFAAVPGAPRDLSRADTRVIHLLTAEPDQARLTRALAAQYRFLSPAALFTGELRGSAGRNAPVRVMGAAAAQSARARWAVRRSKA